MKNESDDNIIQNITDHLRLSDDCNDTLVTRTQSQLENKMKLNRLLQLRTVAHAHE